MSFPICRLSLFPIAALQSRLRWLLAGWLFAAAASAAAAGLPGGLLQGSEPADAASAPVGAAATPEDWAARLAAAQAMHRQLLAQTDGSAPLLAERQLAAARLVGLLSIRIATLGDESAAATAEPAPAPPTPTLGGSPPYSMVEVDALRDRLDALKAEQATLRLTMKSLDAEVEAAVAARAAAAANLRRRQEQAGPGAGGQEPGRAAAELELADLGSQIAELQLLQADAERQRTSERLAALSGPLAQLQAEVDRVRGAQRLDDADLDKLLRQFAADGRKRAAERNRVAEQLSRRESEAAGGGPARLRELQILRQSRATLRELESLESSGPAMWRSRKDALDAGSDPDKRQAAAAALTRGIEQVQGWQHNLSEQDGLLLSELRTRQVALRNLDAADPSRAAEQRVVEALQTQLELQGQLRDSLDWGRALMSRSLADLRIASRPDSLGGWLERIRSVALDWLGAIWNFELFSATEATQIDGRVVNVEYGVTVGKSIGALLLLGLGYWGSVFISRLLIDQMMRRMRLSVHVARVLRRWVKSMLFLAVLLLVLKMARIPITAFAFLGGALAIGVGFGTQTIIRNLISGFILLIERKVRVGDIVSVGGMSGIVQTVDLRATTIRGFDGIEAIVPNSSLLENQISNWSGSSPDIRRAVVVGVAYGSDLPLAAQIIRGCAAAHESVLAEPAPEVLFEDFGSDSLTLRLLYWTRLGGPRGGPTVDSDLRFAIAAALDAAGVVIAFPQRDVHLDMAAPLRVEIAEPGRGHFERPQGGGPRIQGQEP